MATAESLNSAANGPSSPKEKKRNSARFGNRSRPISADENYDAHVMRLWRTHLSDTGRSCGKNSSHWKAWLKDLDIGSIADVDGEVLVAEIECDCDEDEAEENCEHTSIPTTESGMVLPPAIHEDRQVGPALYHQ